MLGAVADGESAFGGFGVSEDTLATVDAARALGAEVELDGDRVRTGVGLRRLSEPAGPIDCGNAGTLMRLRPGLLAGQGGSFPSSSETSRSRRPLDRIADPLREMGATVETTDGHAPLRVAGGELRRIRWELPVASAQVKSCILLAGLLAADGATAVVEPAPTRDHTERLLRRRERGCG